ERSCGPGRPTGSPRPCGSSRDDGRPCASCLYPCGATFRYEVAGEKGRREAGSVGRVASQANYRPDGRIPQDTEFEGEPACPGAVRERGRGQAQAQAGPALGREGNLLSENLPRAAGADRRGQRAAQPRGGSLAAV